MSKGRTRAQRVRAGLTRTVVPRKADESAKSNLLADNFGISAKKLNPRIRRYRALIVGFLLVTSTFFFARKRGGNGCLEL